MDYRDLMFVCQIFVWNTNLEWLVRPTNSERRWKNELQKIIQGIPCELSLLLLLLSFLQSNCPSEDCNFELKLPKWKKESAVYNMRPKQMNVIRKGDSIVARYEPK